VVSEEVFAWRRLTYGAHAVIGGLDDQRMMAAAAEGVRYVLDRIDGGHRWVTVVRVFDSTVGTDIGDVKFAAVQATCQTLGVLCHYQRGYRFSNCCRSTEERDA